jgi:cytochrome c oxidase subunit 2
MRKLEGLLVALLFAGTALVGAWWGAHRWLPVLASRHGAGIDSMLNYLLLTVGALFVSGYVALAWFIFRGTRRDAIGPRLASKKTERLLSAGLGLTMALVAEGGVLAIGIPVWAEYFDATPPADAVEIEVTAQQFMWNVRYPGADRTFGRTDPKLVDDNANPLGLEPSDPAGKDDVIGLNDITVPFGRVVHIRLRSKDVIHSFFLPQFRVKQDAVPGMTPEVTFFPTRMGQFEVACAELCGLAHYRMRATFNVVSEKDFEEWLRKQKS